MSYGSRYTLDDVVQSMKKTGVGLKGTSYEDLLTDSLSDGEILQS